MGRLVFAIAAAFLGASAAHAGEIDERLRGHISFTLTSPKPPVALEYCVADVVSDMGTAAALRDGPDRIIVTSTAGLGEKVIAAIELNGTGGSTQVIGHIYGKGWDDRMRERIARCL